MDKSQVIERFKQEVAVQEERLRTNKQQIKELCQELGYDPETVTAEQVKADYEVKKKEQEEAEAQLQKLVEDYDREFAEK